MTGSALVRGERRRELDGVRGLAVVAVVAYHLDVPGATGGFLGVDVFFVLSGYLITARLLREQELYGRISLRSFWAARARRLLPLAWIVLTVVTIAGVWGQWGGDRQRLLPGETVAAFAHMANWWQQANGGYLQRFASPSPLRHFWSLSIEEQFYLLWPPLLVGAAWLGGRLGRSVRRSAAAVVVFGAVASVGVGLLAAPEAAYLHTGVRAVALMTGAALAVAGPRLSGHRWSMPVAAGGGMAGATALVSLATVAHPDSPWLAPGGLLAAAGAGLLVCWAALDGGPVWSRLLGTAPLVWLGVRSYAIYLVHWPVILMVDPERRLPVRVALVVGVSLLVAALAHPLIERPVIDRRVASRWLGAGAVGVVSIVAVALVAAVPRTPTPTELVERSLAEVPDPADTPAATDAAGPAVEAPTTTCVPQADPGIALDGGTDRFDPDTMSEVADPGSAGCGAVRVLVVGDSTGRGVSNGLRSLGDPRVQVWDRTHFGCSYATDAHPECPPWRSYWRDELTALRPDLMIVAAGVVERLEGADDSDFLDPSGEARRLAVMGEAVELARSVGSTTMLVAAPVPRRPEGLFFCDRRARRSACDPGWVAAWNQSVATAALSSGAKVLDVSGWLTARGDRRDDRPDGLHLSAPALRDQSMWMLPQVLAAATG